MKSIHHGDDHSVNSKVNTFQCVVATDGTRTFAIFLYLDNGINWTTGDFSGGVNGTGGNEAEVGFSPNQGDAFLIEGSSTEDVINIEEKTNLPAYVATNVCHKGLFVFQVNNNEIRSPSNGNYNCCIIIIIIINSIEATCPVTCTKNRIIQSACEILYSTGAELPLPCQQRLCI